MNTVQGIRGSQEPLYRSVPPGAVQSWGPAFSEFAFSIGLNLDIGQKDILNDGLSTRSDGLWLAREVDDIEPRQNGKSLLFEIRALGGVYLLKEPLVIWTAHEFKTAHGSFLHVKDLVTNWDHLRKRVRSIRDSGARTEIELQNPTRKISFLARSGGSGRGFAQVSPLLLDEGFALTPEQMAALQYAMSAARNPQVWIGSSAPLVTSDVLRDVVKDGRKGGKRTVYYEWSAPGEIKELARIAEVNRARVKNGLPSDDDFQRLTAASNRSIGRPGGVGVTIESAEEELKKSTDVYVFLRERWGVFSDLEEGGKINPASWDALGDPESRRAGDVSLAVDISLGRDWYSVVMAGPREDGKEHVQLVRSGSDINEIVPFLVDANETLAPVCFAMAAGTYAALKVQLKSAGFLRPEERPIDTASRQLEGALAHPPQRGDLLILNGTDMGAACGRFLSSVKGGTLRHVPSDQLTQATRVGQTRVSGSQLAWVTSDENMDITALVAASEATWAHDARAGDIEDYDPADDIW